MAPRGWCASRGTRMTTVAGSRAVLPAGGQLRDQTKLAVKILKKQCFATVYGGADELHICRVSSSKPVQFSQRNFLFYLPKSA